MNLVFSEIRLKNIIFKTCKCQLLQTEKLLKANHVELKHMEYEMG